MFIYISVPVASHFFKRLGGNASTNLAKESHAYPSSDAAVLAKRSGVHPPTKKPIYRILFLTCLSGLFRRNMINIKVCLLVLMVLTGGAAFAGGGGQNNIDSPIRKLGSAVANASKAICYSKLLARLQDQNLHLNIHSEIQS